MGTPAIVNQGNISFTNPRSAREAFESIEKWVTKALSGNLPEEQNGDYNIHNVDYENGASFITFKTDSSRYQNLEWQMINFRDFCKQLKDIEYFDASVWIQSDVSIFWDASEEELELSTTNL
jgi:hypothetical protein